MPLKLVWDKPIKALGKHQLECQALHCNMVLKVDDSGALVHLAKDAHLLRGLWC